MSDQVDKYVEAGKNDAVRVRAFQIGIQGLEGMSAQAHQSLIKAYVESMPKAYAGVSVVINDSGDKAKMEAWVRNELVPSIERAGKETRCHQ